MSKILWKPQQKNSQSSQMMAFINFVNDRFNSSIKNYHDLEEFIIDSEKSSLKYLVIDKDSELFDDLRINPAGYPYLVKKFDSGDFDYTNQFSIYEINYEK